MTGASEKASIKGKEKFEDTKGVIRSCKSKDRQREVNPSAPIE